mgnify:FL=1
MSKKNKHYGFPYDYSSKKPLHRFRKDDAEMLFYSENRGYIMLQKTPNQQQRVALNELSFSNMLGMLDKNGWTEVRI